MLSRSAATLTGLPDNLASARIVESRCNAYYPEAKADAAFNLWSKLVFCGSLAYLLQ
jgi:hypothetical protein